MTPKSVPMKEEQTHRHREWTCDCQGVEGWGTDLGLANANYYIENG